MQFNADQKLFRRLDRRNINHNIHFIAPSSTPSLLVGKQMVYWRKSAMRRTIIRKKSGHELIAIVAIYAFVLIVLAILWQLFGF